MSGQAEARRRPGRPTADEAAEGETRERILTAAEELFRGRGYAAVSIGDIAAAVGVTKATLYYHFSGKDAIYTAVMCHTFGAIGEAALRVARAPGPLRERLHLLVEIALRQVPQDANMDAMMRDAHQHLTAAQRGEIDRAAKSMADAYVELMRRGIEEGELRPADPRLLSDTFFHVVAAALGQRGAGSMFGAVPAHAGTVVDLFLYGAAEGGIPRGYPATS